MLVQGGCGLGPVRSVTARWGNRLHMGRKERQGKEGKVCGSAYGLQGGWQEGGCALHARYMHHVR